MWSRRLGFQVAIAAACLGGPGIAAAEVHELRVGTSIDPIIGGQVTEPGEFDGVVAIQAGNGLCTGTVVAPRLVLTAAHCLDHLSSDADVVVHYGQEINQMTIQATGWGVHPQFCPDCKEDIYDYGYVEIGADFNVPGGYTLPVATQEEWDQAMTPGKEVTLVGYGDSSDDGAVQGGIGIKRKVTTTIRKISPAGLEFYAGGNEQDSCNGDSGGPAFVRVASGALRLAGITSRGSSPCGNGGYYGAPYPALCWIRDETDVDFLGFECANCDCIDTAPPGDDSRCAVAGTPRFDDARAWLVSLAVVHVVGRRRRRRAAAVRPR